MCVIEGLDGDEATKKPGRKEGVAYCWKNTLGEAIAEASRTTSVSRAGIRSAIWLRDIAKAKDRKTATYAAWKLLFYEHQRPDHALATQVQLEAMMCFTSW